MCYYEEVNTVLNPIATCVPREGAVIEVTGGRGNQKHYISVNENKIQNVNLH
jgi:hypothetical protein